MSSFFRFLLIVLTMITGPAFGRYIHTYAEWSKLPAGEAAAYLTGVYETIVLWGTNPPQRYARHYSSCMENAKLNRDLVAENVRSFASVRPELQKDHMLVVLIKYLDDLCGKPPPPVPAVYVSLQSCNLPKPKTEKDEIAVLREFSRRDFGDLPQNSLSPERATLKQVLESRLFDKSAIEEIAKRELVGRKIQEADQILKDLGFQGGPTIYWWHEPPGCGTILHAHIGILPEWQNLELRGLKANVLFSRL